MSASSIVLTDLPTTQPVKIVQLFEHLELFSEGEPPRHTLFVLARVRLTQLDSLDLPADQLLLIDPPLDVRQRFKLEGDLAVLFTGKAEEVGLPALQTAAGGVAHIRIGEHFLDIYTQRQGAIVHVPALGILCGGHFGSDAILPQVAPGSDGSEELDTLRLLARLIKQSRLQLYIPRIGALNSNPTDVMMRLAADVAYLHSLRRVVPALVARGEAVAMLLQLSESLLPEGRRSALCREVHLANLQTLYAVEENKFIG
jgi:hypothetical protein